MSDVEQQSTRAYQLILF